MSIPEALVWVAVIVVLGPIVTPVVAMAVVLLGAVISAAVMTAIDWGLDAARWCASGARRLLDRGSS